MAMINWKDCKTKARERDFYHDFSKVKVVEHSNSCQNELNQLSNFSKHLAPQQNGFMPSGRSSSLLHHFGKNWQPPTSPPSNHRLSTDDENCPINFITSSQNTSTRSNKPLLTLEKIPSVYIDGKQATGEKCEDKTHSFTAQDHPRLCFRGNTSTLSNRDSQRHDLSPAIDGKPSGLATTAPLHEATSANRKSHSWPVVVTSQHQSQSSTMSSGYSTHTSSAVVCPCSCHRACCTSTAVQTDHLNVEHQETSSGAEAPSSGVAPSHSAQCLTLNANFPSTDTAICKNKSWSLQQELNNHRTGSYSTSSSDGESQVKDKDKDSTSVKSWNFDGLDAILSTNLLKECYSAVGKANHNVVEPQLSDDIIMKIVKQGEQVQKENCKANLIVPIKQSFSFPMIRKSMTKDEEESSLRSTSAVPSSKSVDVYVRQREPSIDFNMLTEELRKDKSLPSQIWSKQAEVLHEIIEKSKIEMSRVARVKKRFRRAARRIKKGVSSALKKIVCF